MNLNERITAFATQVGNDIQGILVEKGVLSDLNTTEKTNLVGAVNEVLTQIASSGGGDLLATNNLSELTDFVTARTNLDVPSTGDLSSAVAAITLGSLGGLTQSEVDARVQVIVDTAPAALDTLKEIADALGNDPNFAATITTALGNRLRFDAPQTLSVAQKLQGSTNLGIGDPDTDILAAYVNARDN